MVYLSLVVPFYGVEKYIRACLDSLYRQDMPEADYEVICVNDCSPDGSESIVREMQNRHSNLHLICHETNKKLGAARNTGLAAAQGRYVWFIDSDDYIRDNCLKTIVEYCENDQLEILHWSIQDNSGKWITRIEESDVTTGKYDLISGSQDLTFPWNRVYKREFLINNNLWFNDVWGGDVIHTMQALDLAERTKGVSDCFYFYRTDNLNSDMRSPLTAHKVISFSYVLAKEIDNAAPQMSPEFQPLAKQGVKWRVNSSFKQILKLPFNEKRKFYKSMSEQVELRRFVMKRADWKSRVALSCPVCVCALHPIISLLKRVKANTL